MHTLQPLNCMMCLQRIAYCRLTLYSGTFAFRKLLDNLQQVTGRFAQRVAPISYDRKLESLQAKLRTDSTFIRNLHLISLDYIIPNDNLFCTFWELLFQPTCLELSFVVAQVDNERSTVSFLLWDEAGVDVTVKYYGNKRSLTQHTFLTLLAKPFSLNRVLASQWQGTQKDQIRDYSLPNIKMETEPLLSGSINRVSDDYGSQPCSGHHGGEIPKTRRLSYSVTRDSCCYEGGKCIIIGK